MEIPAGFPDASIPSRMRDLLSQRLGDGWYALMRNHVLELLQGYIISEVRASIFAPFLLGVVEGYQNLFSMIESLAGKFVFTSQECSY